MCQARPTGLYTSWEFDTDMQRFKAGHNRIRNFENMVKSFYQETRPKYKIESFFKSGKPKKLTGLKWTFILITVGQCLKQCDVTTISVLVKKVVPG